MEKTKTSKKIKTSILSVVGLFLPYNEKWLGGLNNRWVFSLTIGSVPLGWIIIAVALLVKYI